MNLLFRPANLKSLPSGRGGKETAAELRRLPGKRPGGIADYKFSAKWSG
jgi:hypothetical protein